MNFKSKFQEQIKKNRMRLKIFGPGLITGGAGDDPAGVATYTLVGAATGFSQLWLLLLSTPMMIAIQFSIARIALVTQKSFPEIITIHYSRRLTIFIVLLLAIANILTIGADLNAIATTIALFFDIKPIYMLIPITLYIFFLIIFGKYKTVRNVLITLTAILGVYIVSAIILKPNIGTLLNNTFIPHISFESTWIIAALGMLGTTISPYLLFWQAAEEKEEKKSVTQVEEVKIDTIAGMIYSNLLAYCMIITGAMTLFGRDIHSLDITSLSLTLQPLTSHYAFLLFSIGIVVSGLLALPVLAGSTAYAIADTFGWREGMDNKVSDAKGFYFVFLGSLLVGDLIDMFPTISVVDALYYSQVFDGILIPFLIWIVFIIGNNKEIMKDQIPSYILNFFSLLAMGLTLILSLIMFYQIWKSS